MEAEKPVVRLHMAYHLHELIGDTAVYGWEWVRAFHAVCLQQLEHGRVTWKDDDAKLRYRWALV